MFKIYLTNFGYFTGASHATLEAAIAACKAACFEVQVYDSNDELVATWSPIGGTRSYKRTSEAA